MFGYKLVEGSHCLLFLTTASLHPQTRIPSKDHIAKEDNKK